MAGSSLEGKQAAHKLMSAEAHWEARWIYWMARPTTTIEPNLAMIQLGQPGAVEQNLSQWVDGDHERRTPGQADRTVALFSDRPGGTPVPSRASRRQARPCRSR